MRLRGSHRDRASTFLLIGGLVVAAAFVAISPAVSVPALHKIHGDGFGLHDVGRIYVEGWNSPAYNPFAYGRFRLLTVILTALYLSATTAIGLHLVRLLPGSARWPRPVRILGSFLPGYLMVLGPLQIVFAAIPIPAASWVALVLVFVAAIASHRKALDGCKQWLGSLTLRSALVVLAGVFGPFALAALWRLQAGRNFMANDSVITLLTAAQAELAAKGTVYLLQWDQQSDEWLFAAPLMFTSRAGEDYLLPLYVGSALGLASFACLVYGLVSHWAPRRRLLTGVIATGVVLAATPAIYPIYFISLFGGQNPAIWLGHQGRYIGIVAPWIAILLVGSARGNLRHAAVVFTTLGLGFLSVHTTVFVVAAVGAALLWRHVPRARGTNLERASDLPLFLVGASALAAPLITYALLRRVPWPHELAWILLAGALAAGIAFVLLLIGSPQTAGVRRAPVAPLGLWLLVLALGFVLSNNLSANLTDGMTRELLGTILPGYDRVISSRQLLGDDPLAGLTFPLFSGQECWISGHCLSVGGYVASYGFMTVAAFAGWFALTRAQMPAEARAAMRASWLVCVAAIAVAFALVDFTGAAQGTAWILTRFIEVPYYALLCLAVLALVTVRDKLAASLAAAVFLTWTIVPLAANNVPAQLGKNAHWYLQLLIP